MRKDNAQVKQWPENSIEFPQPPGTDGWKVAISRNIRVPSSRGPQVQSRKLTWEQAYFEQIIYKSRIDAWGWWHVPQRTPIQSPRETISSCSTSTKFRCPTTKSYIPKLALRIPKYVWKTSATKTTNFIQTWSNWWLSRPSEKYEFVSWDYYSQYMDKCSKPPTNGVSVNNNPAPSGCAVALPEPAHVAPRRSLPGGCPRGPQISPEMACFSGIDGYIIHRQIYTEIDPTHHMYIYIYMYAYIYICMHIYNIYIYVCVYVQ